MRVLYFSTDYGPHDHRFLAALARTDHKVFFLRLQRSERQVEDRPVPPEIEQVPWAWDQTPFRWRDVPGRVRALRAIIRRVRPDLIHAGPIQTCAFLAVLTGFRPVLTMSWGFDLMQDADRNGWWRWVTRYTLRRSSYFVSDAQVTRSRAVALGMRSDRTAIFPWGVDLQQFRPPASTGSDERSPAQKTWSGSRAARPFVVLCNRSWEPRYGVDVLARAFVTVADEDASFSMILLGGGSQAAAIRAILSRGDDLDRVQFAGQVPQARLPDVYQRADLFVSPSHVDGSSVSLMEALACGMPVLVSDIPANREWVQDGINGWLFRDGDSDDLARKMRWISTHESMRKGIGRAARKTAEDRADWAKNFQVLLRSYEAAMQAA